MVFSATATGAVTGFAFVDSNNDGIRNAGEFTIPGVTVKLTGKPWAISSPTLKSRCLKDGPKSPRNRPPR